MAVGNELSCNLLALQTRKGLEPSAVGGCGSWKRQGNRFSARAAGRSQPCRHLHPSETRWDFPLPELYENMPVAFQPVSWQ